MTLDEAIEHCEEKAKCGDSCGREHKQLAEWLRELKVFRKIFKLFNSLIIFLLTVSSSISYIIPIFPFFITILSISAGALST